MDLQAYCRVDKLATDLTLDTVFSRHQDDFKCRLVTVQEIKAKMQFKPNIKPKFFKPRASDRKLKRSCLIWRNN